MNNKDRRAINSMIHDAWNENNAFCRKLKLYLGKYFAYDEDVRDRCEDSYCKKVSANE